MLDARRTFCSAVNVAHVLPSVVQSTYLNWFYHEIIKSLPDNISVTQINQQANNILIQDDAKSIIVLEDSQRVVADYVYLTTGHSDNAKTFDDHLVERFIANKYKKMNAWTTIRLLIQ